MPGIGSMLGSALLGGAGGGGGSSSSGSSAGVDSRQKTSVNIENPNNTGLLIAAVTVAGTLAIAALFLLRR